MTYRIDSKVRWKTVNGYTTGIVKRVLPSGHAVVRTDKGYVVLGTTGKVEEVKDE